MNVRNFPRSVSFGPLTNRISSLTPSLSSLFSGSPPAITSHPPSKTLQQRNFAYQPPRNRPYGGSAHPAVKPKPKGREHLLVSSSGKDKVGVIANFTKAILALDGNVIETKAARLGGHFR